MPGRLNIFQRVMLQWNELHPYNAVNVVRIPGAVDSGRLQKIINGTLETWGLTGLTLNRKSGNFHYHGGSVQCEIKIIAAGEDSLSSEIERQINMAFPAEESFNPFRFFVAPRPIVAASSGVAREKTGRDSVAGRQHEKFQPSALPRSAEHGKRLRLF